MRLSRWSVISVFSLLVLSLGFVSRTNATTTKISVSPSSATLQAGHTQTFIVTATDSTGTTKDVTADSTLSSNDPNGKVSGATYTAGQVGNWTIQVAYQSFVTTAKVSVSAGDVAELVINPNSDPEVILTGTRKRFSVEAFDAKHNPLDTPHITWSVIGAIGSIDSTGVFTPTGIGTGKVQAQSDSVTGQVAIEVRQAPVTNTNSSVTTNTNTTTNTNRPTNRNTNSSNTNSATNANTNVATNQNTNSSNVNATNANTNTSTLVTSSQCTSLKPWVWTVMLILFLILVAILYGLVPVTKIWPVVVALISAGVLAFIQRKYDCNLQTWWAWVITLGTVALTALAIRSNPSTGGQNQTPSNS